MYVGVASFPATLAPECEHVNHAVEESIFSHISDVKGRKSGKTVSVADPEI